MQAKAVVLAAAWVMAAPLAWAQESGAAATAAQANSQPGLVALLAPDPGLRTARGGHDSGPTGEKEIKLAVSHAIAHKPKGRWWCVPFARMVSGINLRGNAKQWWQAAKGRYARGHDPQVGAVIAFAASRAMPKGHLAVVSQVISEREILVVQANWQRARVTLDDRVIDVSEKGDWSRVRVQNKNGTLGRINPVHGFIYKG